MIADHERFDICISVMAYFTRRYYIRKCAVVPGRCRKLLTPGSVAFMMSMMSEADGKTESNVTAAGRLLAFAG